MSKLGSLGCGLALALALLLGLPAQSAALTTAQGTITWNFDTAPSYRQYNYGDQQFGSLTYGESTIYYPTGGNWGPYGAAYMPYKPYQDGGNMLDASWSSGSLTESLSVVGASPAPGHWASSVVDLYASMLFPDSETFPAFSVDYDFYGTLDADYNFVLFNLQVELRYGSWGTIVYSNYGDEFDDRLTFRVWEEGVLDEEGTKQFGPFQRPEGQEGLGWMLRYDFTGQAFDYTGAGEPPTPGVPEPATMLLVGGGLLGLAGLRRRQG